MPGSFPLLSKLGKRRLSQMDQLFHSHTCHGWADVEVPFLLLSSTWNSKQMSRRPEAFERNAVKRRKQASIMKSLAIEPGDLSSIPSSRCVLKTTLVPHPQTHTHIHTMNNKMF